jgi:hypothetical protein
MLIRGPDSVPFHTLTPMALLANSSRAPMARLVSRVRLCLLRCFSQSLTGTTNRIKKRSVAACTFLTFECILTSDRHVS